MIWSAFDPWLVGEIAPSRIVGDRLPQEQGLALLRSPNRKRPARMSHWEALKNPEPLNTLMKNETRCFLVEG